MYFGEWALLPGRATLILLNHVGNQVSMSRQGCARYAGAGPQRRPWEQTCVAMTDDALMCRHVMIIDPRSPFEVKVACCSVPRHSLRRSPASSRLRPQ